MITIATYWWTASGQKASGYHQYTPDDVRLLQRMVSRNITAPHEFAVITDKPEAFADDTAIRAVQLDYSTHVDGTCFVRLMTFSPFAAATVGERVLQIDLDTIIVGNLDSIVSRTDNLVMWRNPGRVPWDRPKIGVGRPYYNTSMLLHRPGTMPELWSQFDRDNPKYRDDQWYLSDKLGASVPYFDGSDGVYRLAREDTPGSGVWGELPENARVVTFPGSDGKHWEPHIAEANPWISEFRK